MAADELGPVDFDLLADYVGGALDDSDEAVVARLIAEDPHWRRTYQLLAAGMAAAGAELSDLGSTPEPMPADLAVRLEQAFASARTTTSIADPTIIDPALVAPTEPHLEPVRGGDAADHHVSLGPASADRGAHGPGREARGRRRKRLRWAVPIAAAAGVLALAGVGFDYLTNGAGESAQSATSAAGSAERAAPMVDDAGSAGPAPVLRDEQILATGTNYTATTLGSTVSGYGTDRAKADPSGTASTQLTQRDAGRFSRLRDPAALRACLEAITQTAGQGPIEVQTVDYAQYDGRPALVVRFIAGGMTWSFAAGPNCGTPERGADELKWVQVR